MLWMLNFDFSSAGFTKSRCTKQKIEIYDHVVQPHETTQEMCVCVIERPLSWESRDIWVSLADWMLAILYSE